MIYDVSLSRLILTACQSILTKYKRIGLEIFFVLSKIQKSVEVWKSATSVSYSHTQPY